VGGQREPRERIDRGKVRVEEPGGIAGDRARSRSCRPPREAGDEIRHVGGPDPSLERQMGSAPPRA
jgi:hypothetical protein